MLAQERKAFRRPRTQVLVSDEDRDDESGSTQPLRFPFFLNFHDD
jgi:hypothetical protein